MKITTFKGLLLGAACVALPYARTNAQAFTENFNDITTLSGSGWAMINNSSPVGSIANWFQGTSVSGGGPFDAYNGAGNAYIAANYNFVAGANTINGWLITPNRTFRNGDVLTFYTRKATPDTYPDRLEVRLSTNGASTNAGVTSSDVGDFTTLLMSVNPSLVTGVYPTAWTQYTITLSGLPAPTSGRIAFRYFVTNGGPSGSNSDYIGIDNVVYTPYVCPTFTMTAGGALTGGTAGASYTTTLTQTGALGTPNFAVTAGALPPGLTLGSGGTISGTPTATGTFNFTVTVSDNSGCSGSDNYSIQVVCPPNPIAFAGLPTLCSNDGAYTLTEASPAGGVYSGAGVSADMFDPSAGTQTITYDYTDPYGCAHSSNATITVNTAPVVTHDPVSDVCDGDAAFTVTGGMPAGGTYSGTGVSGDMFDPSAGTQTIDYSYTDGNGCSEMASVTITVNPLPAVTHDAVDAVCADAAPFTLSGGIPAGGVYSGTGISGNDFDPAAGTQTVTYAYTDANGCSASTDVDITVNALPGVTLSLTENMLCVYDDAITLAGGAPSGGAYSGTAVTAGAFDPAAAGAGTVTITYDYTDGNGCSASATDDIVVDDCLGINEMQSEYVSIYPNPGTGVFTVQTTVSLNGECYVTDLNGKHVNARINGAQIDLSGAESGVYLVHGKTDKGAFVVRLVKQ